MLSRVSHRRLPARIIILCGLLFVLGACGQKGPLYLPEKTDKDQTEENADSGN